MSDYLLAVGVALTGWWFFTGIILWLVHLRPRWQGAVFMTWTALLVPMLWAIDALAENTSTTAVVVSFTLALLVWGWLEMGYLIGWITGPRHRPATSGATRWQRMGEGLATCLYHELALLALLLTLTVSTLGAANVTGLLAFAVLWLMRWSAKLNLVLGVRNYNKSWLPDHLDYLDSYIPRRRMNGLFPFSLVAGLGITAWLGLRALDAITLAEQVSYTLAATLAVLGTLEHVFLMLPLGDARLWQWAAPREAPRVTKVFGSAFATQETPVSRR